MTNPLRTPISGSHLNRKPPVSLTIAEIVELLFNEANYHDAMSATGNRGESARGVELRVIAYDLERNGIQAAAVAVSGSPPNELASVVRMLLDAYHDDRAVTEAELARADAALVGASGSPPSPPEGVIVLPSIPNLRRAQERLAGYGEHRMAQDIQLAIEVVEARASSGSTGAPNAQPTPPHTVPIDLLMARSIIAEFVEMDSDECRYDHHDQCQTHLLHLRPCPYTRAKIFLSAPLAQPGAGSTGAPSDQPTPPTRLYVDSQIIYLSPKGIGIESDDDVPEELVDSLGGHTIQVFDGQITSWAKMDEDERNLHPGAKDCDEYWVGNFRYATPAEIAAFFGSAVPPAGSTGGAPTREKQSDV